MTSIQIFSPHIDDAVFSLGGSILNWRKKGINIKVHNIFTISNWITPNSISGIKDNLDLHEVSALRKNEETLVGKYVKFDFHLWGFLELPLRKKFSEQDDEKMKGEILSKIFSCLNSDDLFFFPIGIEHEDHILINQLTENFTNKGFKLFFYEDMPYVSCGAFVKHLVAGDCAYDTFFWLVFFLIVCPLPLPIKSRGVLVPVNLQLFATTLNFFI